MAKFSHSKSLVHHQCNSHIIAIYEVAVITTTHTTRYSVL